MCTRYALFNIPDKVKDDYKIGDYKKDYNISPFSECLIISKGKGITKRWGLKTKDFSIVNARIETYEEKPLFKNANRCIVPMNGFYEWKNKIPYYFHNEAILYACGLILDKGFVMLTTKANDSVKRIHDRMPLFTDNPDDWIKKKIHKDKALKKQTVTKIMNSVHYKSPDCIVKIKTLDDY